MERGLCTCDRQDGGRATDQPTSLHSSLHTVLGVVLIYFILIRMSEYKEQGCWGGAVFDLFYFNMVE